VPTPTWLAASPGSPPQAAQVNQFLGAHAVTFIYTGNQKDAQLTVGAGSTASNGLYVAQSFTAGGTYTLGRFTLLVSVTGTPAPLTLTVRPDNAGAPSATILSTVTVPYGWIGAGSALVSFPAPNVAVVSGTKYWLVGAAVGDVSNFYSYFKSNQVTGASTSVNGTAWAAQAFGDVFFTSDLTVTGPLAHTWEDSGAHWTGIGTNANTTVSGLNEYTAAQVANDYVFSKRSLTYTGADLTKVS
jgi:hypothetical protein